MKPGLTFSSVHLFVFNVLWAVAHIAHVLRKEATGEPLVWILLLACVFVIHKPSSPARIGFLALSQIFLFIERLPFTDNHMYLMAFANAGIVAIVASIYVKEREWSDADIQHLTSYVVLVLTISYSAAAIAKLNAGFFSPHGNCAVSMFYDSMEILGVQRGSAPFAFETVMPFVVTAIELSVPLLLIIPRTRLYGILLVVAFHLSISLSPTATALDFTLVVFAMVYLLLPKQCSRYVTLVASTFDRTVLSRLTAHRSTLLMLLLFAVLVALKWRPGTIAGNKAWALLAPGAILVGAGLVLLVITSMTNKWATYNVFAKLKPLQYAFIGLLLFDVATPYLGIKTAGTFTMYSNLDTFGGTSNHFFIPRFHLADFEDDLVEVTSTSNESLGRMHERGLDVTWHELRRTLASDPEASISYIRNHEIYSFERAAENPDLVSLDPILHKVVGLRPRTARSQECLW